MKGLDIEDFFARIEIGKISLIKQLVEYGCGITFLYQTAVKRELKEGRLCEISLSDMEITHDFTFIWRQDSIFSQYYREIFRILKTNREKNWRNSNEGIRVCLKNKNCTKRMFHFLFS